ncbi:hypothetical protein AVEN_19628-1 [Araneus ventricosus]|uniref:Uncharacterized protein n=1 Tax=Araneus ventricosus TaxID=182803 RepID=A0A4Y2KM76_ARAVE|nr:hypothetical protein AVEN_19628-1 [Araneus ventricosus]
MSTRASLAARNVDVEVKRINSTSRTNLAREMIRWISIDHEESVDEDLLRINCKFSIPIEYLLTLEENHHCLASQISGLTLVDDFAWDRLHTCRATHGIGNLKKGTNPKVVFSGK